MGTKLPAAHHVAADLSLKRTRTSRLAGPAGQPPEISELQGIESRRHLCEQALTSDDAQTWHARVVERGLAVGVADGGSSYMEGSAHGSGRSAQKLNVLRRYPSSVRDLTRGASIFFGNRKSDDDSGAPVLGRRSCWQATQTRDDRAAFRRSRWLQILKWRWTTNGSLWYMPISSTQSYPKTTARGLLPKLMYTLAVFTVVEAIVAGIAGRYWKPGTLDACSNVGPGDPLDARAACLLPTLGRAKFGVTYVFLFIFCVFKVLHAEFGPQACRWSVAASRDGGFPI